MLTVEMGLSIRLSVHPPFHRYIVQWGVYKCFSVIGCLPYFFHGCGINYHFTSKDMPRLDTAFNIRVTVRDIGYLE